jgi:4-hydroxyphenylpyruvate dioxygenase
MMKKAENPLFINTVCLGGTTDDKLRAAHDAGFQQVELWRQDVEASGGDTAGIKTLLQKLPVGLTDYQVLLDFDGAPDSIREDKRHEALRMLDTAVALGATLLLTPACTHKECVGERIEEDLRWLARQAGQRGLRIAYEGMAWSTKINNTADAWKMVQRVNERIYTVFRWIKSFWSSFLTSPSSQILKTLSTPPAIVDCCRGRASSRFILLSSICKNRVTPVL